MADGVWKGVQSQVIGCPEELSVFAINQSFYENLKNPDWLPWEPKIADGVRKGVQPQVFGHLRQLLKYRFLDPSTPSMRKVEDGGNGGNWNIKK